jgi:hypothetical protein
MPSPLNKPSHALAIGSPLPSPLHMPSQALAIGLRLPSLAVSSRRNPSLRPTPYPAPQMGVATFGGDSHNGSIDDWRHAPPSPQQAEMAAACKRETALEYVRVKNSSRGAYPHEFGEPLWDHWPSIRMSPEKSNVSTFQLQFDSRNLGPTDKVGSPQKNKPHAGRTSFSSVHMSHEAQPPISPSTRAFAGRASHQSYQFNDGAALSPPLRELADGSLAVGYQSASSLHGSRSSVQGDLQWDERLSQLAVDTEYLFRSSSQFARPKLDLDVAGAAATRSTSVVYDLPHDSVSLRNPKPDGQASGKVGKRMVPGALGLTVHVPDTWNENGVPEPTASPRSRGTCFRQDSPGMLTDSAPSRNAPPARRPTDVGQAIEGVPSPSRRQPVRLPHRPRLQCHIAPDIPDPPRDRSRPGHPPMLAIWLAIIEQQPRPLGSRLSSNCSRPGSGVVFCYSHMISPAQTPLARACRNHVNPSSHSIRPQRVSRLSAWL